jgi:alkaline phosphatase
MFSGLFSNSHMAYNSDRDTSDDGQPSLSDMTRLVFLILYIS